MKKKVLIIALSTSFGKAIANAVADNLNLFFLSIDDFIEYSLFDSVKLLKRCGKETYERKEKKAIDECLKFDNMLYSCSYDVFINYKEKFKDFVIYYLHLNKEQLPVFRDNDITINLIAYEDRVKFLKKISNIINATSKNRGEIVKNVLISIREENEN